jgi:hypothetical protein
LARSSRRRLDDIVSPPRRGHRLRARALAAPLGNSRA